MQIVVQSREAVEQGVVMDLQERHRAAHGTLPKLAIVSIQDVAAERPVNLLRHGPALILRLTFEDDLAGPLTMQEHEADLAVQFIVRARDQQVDLLVVHCEAGISRSSAMAAAFSCILGQPAGPFCQEPFFPNATVLCRVLDAWTRSLAK